MQPNRPLLVLSLCILALAVSCSNDETSKLQAKVNELQAQVDAYEAERETTAKNLKTFDDLDLVAFNNRDTMAKVSQHDRRGEATHTPACDDDVRRSRI